MLVLVLGLVLMVVLVLQAYRIPVACIPNCQQVQANIRKARS